MVFCSFSVPPQDPVIQNAQSVEGVSYVIVVEGTQTDVTCLAADGRPAASMQWLYAGDDVSGTATRNVVTKANMKTEDAVGENIARCSNKLLQFFAN